MQVAALRRVLFDLYGTNRFPDTSALDASDWDRLDRIAAQTHLQPLLHVQHRGDARIPPSIAARWQAAYREAAMLALAREAELRSCVARLEAAGFRPLALKGAWLARHAYPEPAQRPMLDIDLLLDPDTVLPAWKLLKAEGYEQAFKAEMALPDILRLDKHLPPLLSPRGILFELHHRLWERPGRLDHGTPQGQDEEVRARAVTRDGLRFPCAPDMLAHLIVHAAYSHRLDCGPRVLADIDMLLRRDPADWTAFWARATREGWRDGARLVLELVRASRADAVVDFTPDPGRAVPDAVLEGAVQLLFVDPAQRTNASLIASVLKGGLPALFGRALGRHGATGEDPVLRDMAGEGGRRGWLTSRLGRLAASIGDRDLHCQARGLARLSRWFDA